MFSSRGKKYRCPLLYSFIIQDANDDDPLPSTFFHGPKHIEISHRNQEETK